MWGLGDCNLIVSNFFIVCIDWRKQCIDLGKQTDESVAFSYKTKSQRTGEHHELHVQETEQPRQVYSFAKDDLSMLSVLYLMEHMMIPVKEWSSGRWRRIGCMVAGLWWFDSPWLDRCSCSRRWRNHHLDSMQRLQNCVIISSGSHVPWDLSLWTVLPEDESSLPRLWRGWVLRPTESTAMEGEEGNRIVGSSNSNHFLPGSVVESKRNPLYH